MEEKKRRVGLALPPDLMEKVEKQAEKMGLSMTNIIIIALNEWLKSQK